MSAFHWSNDLFHVKKVKRTYISSDRSERRGVGRRKILGWRTPMISGETWVFQHDSHKKRWLPTENPKFSETEK
jgi:hypothetical protein